MGIRELLVRVESTGSLPPGRARHGMAYSKAWQILRRAEEHLGFALLDPTDRRQRGGGSIVSDEGRLLAGSFGALVDDADALLDGLVEKHLSAGSNGRTMPALTGSQEAHLPVTVNRAMAATRSDVASITSGSP